MSKKRTKSDNGSTPELTPVSEWLRPRKEGELVLLPSGRWVKLFPVDLLKMVKDGTIPNFLAPIAAKATWSAVDPDAIGESLELAQKYAEFIDVVVPAVFAFPKVALRGEKPGPDEISLEDIDLTDKTAAFNMAVAGVAAMRSFRKQQEKLMAAIPDGNEAGEPSE